MKTAFIIPGFSESEKNNPAYRKIAGFFKKKDIRPVIVDIEWKRKTMSEYVRQFQKIYLEKNQGAEIYFFGFSYGAMIAFISSVEVKPKMQVLCSLSPFFREDFPRIREWWKKYIGKKRLKDFRHISFDALADKIVSDTIILAGNKEGSEVDCRAKDAHKKIKNSRLIIIQNAKHAIQQDEYLAEVKKIISEL